MVFCQNRELNKVIEKVIFDACTYLLENINQQPLAIILTGSFSRGEGSVYKLYDKVIVLGDIEFLIYFKEITKSLRQDLKRLSNDYSNCLKINNIECKIEFGFCTDAFFSRTKPTIFARELLDEGKVLWGDKNLLQRLRHIRKEEIEIIDGFYLLSNRIIEQLKSLNYITIKDNLLEKAAYANIKVLLDIPTAIFVVNKTFETGYINRLNKLVQEYNYIGTQIFNEKDDWTNLLEEIKFWTKYKMKPIPLKDIYLRKFPIWSAISFRDQVLLLWCNLVPIVKKIWEWQIKSIGTSQCVKIRSISKRSNALFKLQPKKEIFKDWIKLLIRYAKAYNELSINMAYFLKASPKHLIYKAASELYFRYPHVLKESGEISFDELEEIDKFLPLKFNISKAKDELNKHDINTIKEKIYNNWTAHVRNN